MILLGIILNMLKIILCLCNQIINYVSVRSWLNSPLNYNAKSNGWHIICTQYIHVKLTISVILQPPQLRRSQRLAVSSCMNSFQAYCQFRSRLSSTQEFLRLYFSLQGSSEATSSRHYCRMANQCYGTILQSMFAIFSLIWTH